MSGAVRDRDKGAKALMKRLGVGKPDKPVSVVVGILEAEGNAQHADDGTTVADVAGFHEFGLGVPERSFLRSWADENVDANKERLRKIAAAVEKGQLPSLEVGLERFGLVAVGEIQRRMPDGYAPDKVDGTPATLIDTGQLRSSITHKVEK